jgi:hypothetical protein
LIVVTVLGFSLIAIAITQAVQTFRMRAAETVSMVPEDLDDVFIPPVFREVRETGEKLSLSGSAEPESVVVIMNGEERLRQVQSNDVGAWQADIAVEQDTQFALSAQVFVDEVSIRGDETVLRIPAPGAEDGLAQRALILITAPGGPSRVVQTPFGGPRGSVALSLESLEYDVRGGAILAGRAQQGGRVRLLSEGRQIGEAPVGDDGRWFFIATDTQIGGTRKALTLQLITPESVVEEIDAGFDVLRPGETLRQEPDLWQVRRDLRGGGSQVSAIFAPIIVDDDESEDADG